MDPLRKSLLLGLDQAPAGSGTAPISLPEVSAPWSAWLQAGADAVYRRAALRPRSDIPDAEPAPLDPRPVLQPALSAVLALAVHHEDPALLSELAAGMARHGLRVSAADLPALLKLRDPELRAAAQPLLGEGGLWLAAQGGWLWAFGDSEVDHEQAWVEGSVAQRLEALRHFRSQDPGAARARLLTSFAGDGAAERLVLIEGLRMGLSLADQELLLQLIDGDRSKKVKAAARVLLLELDVPLRRALAAFVLEHLEVARVPGLRREKLRLAVDLPQSWPPELAWVLEHKHPRLGKLNSGWAEAIARLPMSTWAPYGVPLELVSAADPSEDMATVIGWSQAALEQGASAWMFPLYQWWAERLKDKGGAAREAVEQIRALAPSLPVDRASELMLRLLAQAEHADPTVASAVLDSLPRPWPEPVARAWLGRIARAQQIRDLPRWLSASLKHAAMALPPHLLPQRPLLPGSSTNAVIAFAAKLTARRRIHTLLP